MHVQNCNLWNKGNAGYAIEVSVVGLKTIIKERNNIHSSFLISPSIINITNIISQSIKKKKNKNWSLQGLYGLKTIIKEINNIHSFYVIFPSSINIMNIISHSVKKMRIHLYNDCTLLIFLLYMFKIWFSGYFCWNFVIS